MSKKNWNRKRQNVPPVTWDSEKNLILIRLGNIEAEWKPDITYVARIKEVGAEDWLVGVEIPLNTISFTNLKPDTEYEMELRSKNAAGVESEPASQIVRTSGYGGWIN